MAPAKKFLVYYVLKLDFQPFLQIPMYVGVNGLGQHFLNLIDIRILRLLRFSSILSAIIFEWQSYQIMNKYS